MAPQFQEISTFAQEFSRISHPLFKEIHKDRYPKPHWVTPSWVHLHSPCSSVYFSHYNKSLYFHYFQIHPWIFLTMVLRAPGNWLDLRSHQHLDLPQPTRITFTIELSWDEKPCRMESFSSSRYPGLEWPIEFQMGWKPSGFLNSIIFGKHDFMGSKRKVFGRLYSEILEFRSLINKSTWFYFSLSKIML